MKPIELKNSRHLLLIAIMLVIAVSCVWILQSPLPRKQRVSPEQTILDADPVSADVRAAGKPAPPSRQVAAAVPTTPPMTRAAGTEESAMEHGEDCSPDCQHSRAFQLLEESRGTYARQLFQQFAAARRLRGADKEKLLRACRMVAEYAIQDLSEEDSSPIYQPEETLLALQTEIMGPVLAALPSPAPR